MVVEGAHGGVQQFHAHPRRFPPGGEIHRGDGLFLIESRQPVDALDRALRLPGFDALRQSLGIEGVLDKEHLDAELFQLAGERLADAALI